MSDSKLTEFELWVLDKKGTEAPNTGQYNNATAHGIYCCRKCGAHLYRSEDKFASRCGWPSFDDEIKGAVRKEPDPDGRRTEILCQACGAHLGHVFTGEGYTKKDTRHCVNSISMKFIPDAKVSTEEALFASGCFWGTEFHFAKQPGVVLTEVGYAGGDLKNPTYEQVCTGRTGHVECVRVVFDPQQTSYEELAKLFFETHDFTQVDGQGPDIGPQYKSVVFVKDEKQKHTMEALIHKLTEKGFEVATELKGWTHFYKAEDYHQQYYFRKASTPYCHIYRKVF